MKKALLFIAIIALLVSCAKTTTPEAPFVQSNLEVTSGNLWRADIFSPELNETIKIDVWTPKGYTGSKKYPVIYMHDGQNLFDANSTWNHQAWEIDSVLGSLIADKKVKPAIVVGIHSVDTTRIGDLMPERVVEMTPSGEVRDFIDLMCRGQYRADEYLAFIVNTLKPIIDNKFSTFTDRKSTSIMGSSMGGLISIYGVTEYPEVFGAAVCMSTHWTGAIGDNPDFPTAMKQYLLDNFPRNGDYLLYFDNGDCDYDSQYLPAYNEMNTLFDFLGYREGEKLKTGVFQGHSHSEKSWSERVSIPLQFVLK
ncbi:MAG: hypothetical protein J6B65_04200 [Paludibacteraceae bacterium]|nr:hypothetical protein [Paludibacteraceae bacterium]